MTEFRNNILQAELEKTHIFSVGQAGFIIKTKTGKLIAIDLYLSDCVERIEPDHVGYRRLLPKILSANELVFDTIICTHFHRDHYDIDSIPTLMNNPKTQLFCPRDCEQDIKEEKIDERRVRFIKPGSSFKLEDYELFFVNCDHGTGAPLAVGVIVKIDNKVILEVGDTCLRLDRINEYKTLGDVDVLIAPINGMYGNLNSKDCAILNDTLKAKLVIPCHYGMFAAHMGSIGEFHNIMDKEYPNNKYLMMRQGEQYTLEGDK